jgi:hypothetical protein
MEKGTAVEPYKRLIAYMDTARDKYKAQLIQGHGYLASYYANIAKQKDSAIAHLQSILEVDPTNADAPKYIEALRRTPQKQSTTTAPTKTTPKSPAKTPAKPKTTTKPKAKA